MKCDYCNKEFHKRHERITLEWPRVNDHRFKGGDAHEVQTT